MWKLRIEKPLQMGIFGSGPNRVLREPVGALGGGEGSPLDHLEGLLSEAGEERFQPREALGLVLEGILARQLVEGARNLAPTGDAELVLQRVDVRSRGPRRNAEAGSDFIICESICKELENLFLAM
jgi:hypothetical protein